MPKRIIYEVGEKLHPDSKLRFIKDVSSHRCPSGLKRMALFKCGCGKEVIKHVASVKNGRRKNCGCLSNREWHGKRKHPLYVVWACMKDRCTRDNNIRFDYYGGRGISVCKQWERSFQCFYDWAISNGWNKNLDIDRIDNNGDYSPSNCRFVSRKENNRNTRQSKYWFVDGKRFNSMAQASSAHNVNPATIKNWCDGLTRKRNGKIERYDSRPGCHSELKYA